MLNFEYCSPTSYIFGKGRERETGSYIKPYTNKNKVLIVYDTERITECGLLKTVTDSLEEEKMQAFRGRTQPEIFPCKTGN